ncbi:Uncharacterised protein [Serratia plymuthica]|nr:Uncharacterised protein [Serratia plymuthica]
MAISSHFTVLRAIDSHTAGEPTRLIIEGFPIWAAAVWRSVRRCLRSSMTTGEAP